MQNLAQDLQNYSCWRPKKKHRDMGCEYYDNNTLIKISEKKQGQIMFKPYFNGLFSCSRAPSFDQVKKNLDKVGYN